MTTHPSDPHRDQPILTAGAPLDQASAAMIMLHGRGSTAQDILSLSAYFDPDGAGLAFFAPQAAGNTWYPNRFMTALEGNQPYLDSALAVVGDILARLEGEGIPPERVMLLGFSQGACLATEFAARNARRYGGVAGLSGGLIGPEGPPRDYPGTLAGTPVFLGCSDIDPHIPAERVRETADVLARLGGAVTMRLYPGLDHTIVPDEIAAVQAMLDAIGSPLPGVAA